MASLIETEYRGVSLKLSDVFVSINDDFQSPSKVDGLDDHSEMALRIIGCESIQDAGKMLKLPQVAIACAQVLYHRFYFSKSFVRHNWEHYAMSCVFLSAKIEECCRRLRDVVNVFVHIRQLREHKAIKSLSIPEYAELKPYIIKAERRVLKELGFCVHGKHSHKLICIYLHILGQDQNKDLVQLSWNYMNDSLRTTVFCQHQPEMIACACIYLAITHLQFPINHNWYEIFGGSQEAIEPICLAILRLYAVRGIDVVALEARLNQLKKVQLETRNLKVAAPSKDDGGGAGNNNNNDGGAENRGKENVAERGREHRKRSHRRNKSGTPPRGGRCRSRSTRGRDRSPADEHRRRHAEAPLPPPATQAAASSSSSKKQASSAAAPTTQSRSKQRRSPSPNTSSSADRNTQQHYRKRRRSSSPADSRQYSSRKAAEASRQHSSSRKAHNGGKAHR